MTMDMKFLIYALINKDIGKRYVGKTNNLKWKSYKQINKINYYIGMFNSESEANDARIKFVENFNNTGNPLIVPVSTK